MSSGTSLTRAAPGRSARFATRAGRVAIWAIVTLGAASCTGGTVGDEALTTAVGAGDGGQGDAVVTTTSPVAPGAVPTGSALINERFDGAEPDGWAGVVGWSRVGYGDRVVWSASGSAWAWYPAGEGWSDYTVHLEGRVDAGALAVGLRGGREGRYVVQVGTGGVALLRDAPWGNAATLAHTAPLEPERSHALSAAVVGGRIQVWSDGRLIIDYTDLDPLETGTVTVGAGEGSLVSLDTIRVTALGADLPSANPARSSVVPEAAPARPDAAPEGGPFRSGTLGPEGTTAGDGDDLAVGLVHFDRSVYREGDPVEVSMDVTLDGEGPVGPFLVRFEMGSVACEATVQSLSNFGSTSAVCTIPDLAGPGTPVWQVQVDGGEQVVEHDEANNAVSGTLVVNAGDDDVPLPDLVVMWWATDPVWPPPPDVATAFLARIGPLSPFEGEVVPYTVAVSLDGAVLCNVEVDTTEATVSCPLDAGIGPGRHVLGLLVDAADAVEEGAGEDDNAFEVVIDL